MIVTTHPTCQHMYVCCEYARAVSLLPELLAAGVSPNSMPMTEGIFEGLTLVRWVGMPPPPPTAERLFQLRAPEESPRLPPEWVEYFHPQSGRSVGWNYGRDLALFRVHGG